MKEKIEEYESKNKYKIVFIVCTIIIIITILLIVFRFIINSLYTCEIIPDGLFYCDMPDWLQNVETTIWMLEYIFIPASIISFIIEIIYPIKDNKKLKNNTNQKN